MRTYLSLLLSLLLMVFVAACDSGDSDDDDGNTTSNDFEMSVSGAHTASLKGKALFGTGYDDEVQSDAFAVVLTVDGTDGDEVILGGLGKPARKTYALDDPENGDAAAFLGWKQNKDGEEDIFLASDGSFEITKVNDDRLEGRFSFKAVSLADETREVTVSGSFKANRSTVDEEDDLLARLSTVRVKLP